MLERIAAARSRAEHDALKALHELEVQRLQHQHERQLAARIAAERAAAEEEARTNSIVLGGSAVAAAVASTTALALQTPENRQTAQAVLGFGGGALALAGALSQPGSTARNVCLGLGITAVGIAAADFLCQMFSEPAGGIGVAVRAGHGTLVIQSVVPQSAAATAGLIAGDEILHVDDVPVAQIGAHEATRRLRGDIGSQVRVGVRRHWNGGLEWDVSLVRTPR
ncbi:PDZ domain-containing protein [Nannocystis radixulma]|uniref:PDZ domain-containing protein n=1 Tax=Nannocystis radixulma TaxID=2995305 RepID=A0ABT5B8T6_9BACT|nr:PDZ domain-containing protein [Nannocystis radixulma]MDC0670539.1 PDZ domain-containing protein [Nannocystis radixulma]